MGFLVLELDNFASEKEGNRCPDQDQQSHKNQIGKLPRDYRVDDVRGDHEFETGQDVSAKDRPRIAQIAEITREANAVTQACEQTKQCHEKAK